MGACCCRLRTNALVNYSSGLCQGRYCIPGCASCTRGVVCASREEEIDSSSVQDGRHVQTASAGLVTRQNKSGPVQSGESQLLRVSSGETQGEEVVPFQNLKNAENKSELADCKPDSPEKCQPSKLSDAVVPLADEEDGCPTCLEEYDGENPRIITKCDHHFHLSCILEWMERSDTCPICDQEMIFNETT